MELGQPKKTAQQVSTLVDPDLAIAAADHGDVLSQQDAADDFVVLSQ